MAELTTQEIEKQKQQFLKELKEKTSQLQKGDISQAAFDEWEKGQKKVIDKFPDLKSAIDKVKRTFEDLKQAFSGSAEQIASQAKKLADEYSEFFEGNQEGFKGFQESIGKLGITWAAMAMLPEPKIFDDLGGKDAALNNLTESAENLTKVFGDNSLTKFISEMAGFEQKANDMASGLYSAAAATGQLGEFTSEVGNDFSQVEKKMTNMIEQSYEVAQATGTNIKAVSGIASTLMKSIPGVMDEISNVSTGAGTSLSTLEATMKVALGTGQQTATVVEFMVNSYKKLGTTTQESLENFSKMAVMADRLNLPFDNMKGFIDETAGSFMYFKDNTQALIDVMGRLGPAFQAAKLSPEAIQKLTASMVNNINQMSLAQRSFLSMQTGGPGGLRGGYEIEMLKAQGRFGEIQKKTEEALRKQFSGKIVTLEEAARDEGAARQLATQVQMVTSGPNKLVESEAQAYKLFEAMQGGVSAETVGGQDALQSAVKQGNDRAAQQVSILTNISNFNEKIAMYTAISAKNSSSDTSDIKTVARGLQQAAASKMKGESGKLAQKFAASLEESPEDAREKASQRAAQRNLLNKGREEDKTVVDIFKDFLSNTGILGEDEILEAPQGQKEKSTPESAGTGTEEEDLFPEDLFGIPMEEKNKKETPQEILARVDKGIKSDQAEIPILGKEDMKTRKSFQEWEREMLESPGARVGAVGIKEYSIDINVLGPDNKVVETIVAKIVDDKLSVSKQKTSLANSVGASVG